MKNRVITKDIKGSPLAFAIASLKTSIARWAEGESGNG